MVWSTDGCGLGVWLNGGRGLAALENAAMVAVHFPHPNVP